MVIKENSPVLEVEDELKFMALERSFESDDEEESEDSDALNFSCHNSHFKRLFDEKPCDPLVIKRRKLKTHLSSLDLELASLCFSLDDKTTNTKESCNSRMTKGITEKFDITKTLKLGKSRKRTKMQR
ncbi:predicted protein [Nematostella vectensis]|uniref:Uncharacterized protein n=1 Tax=Nematostella vectensis TaxID=45351 RepID=A7RIE5_NEMVE|nr:predicted protein [Nematostella vectensis]|eukprot:XP_001640860.1 predicted protein [Nematostella vectensis]